MTKEEYLDLLNKYSALAQIHDFVESDKIKIRDTSVTLPIASFEHIIKLLNPKKYMIFNVYGFEFYSEKKDKEWIVAESSTHAIVSRGNSEKEVIEKAKSILRAKGELKTKETIKYLLERIAKEKQLLSKEVRDKFYGYFNTSISPFIRPLLGTSVIMFDIIMFDKWLRTPEGVSTKNYITQKYGRKASDFIAYLNKLF